MLSDPIGALWLKTSRKGNKFLSGEVTVGGSKVSLVVFKNEHKKEGEKTPDYRIFLGTPREPADDDRTPF